MNRTCLAYERYEKEKQKLEEKKLTPEEYDKAIREIVKRLKR